MNNKIRLEVVALVLAALGLLLSVIIYLQQKYDNRKYISISVVSKSEIFSGIESSGVNVTFKNIKVKNIYNTVFEIKVSGRNSISPADFINGKSIELNTGDGCKVLSYNIISASPSSFSRRLKIESSLSTVKILPNLFNHNDMAKIQITTSDCTPSFAVYSDILGISEISLGREPESKSSIRAAMFPTLIAVFIIEVIVYLKYLSAVFKGRRAWRITNDIIAVLLFIATPILLSSIFYYFLSR